MAHLQEELMGLGDFELAVDHDPSLAAELALFRHLTLYWGATAVYTGVILRRRPGRAGVTVGGRSLEWWLGLDDDGPIIVEREYVAGNNKLSNGGFELGELYWKRSEASKWAVRAQAGEPRTATWAAAVTADSTDDDVLEAEESFETRSGRRYRAGLHARRPSGDTGRLRLRTVYEGRFNPPNLVPNPNFEAGWTSWTNLSTTPGDADIVNDAAKARSGTWVARLGPTTRLQLLANPSFEAGLANWYQGAGTWQTTADAPFDGANCVTIAGADGTHKWLEADRVNGGAVDPYPVTAGERYVLEGFVKRGAGANGVVWLDVLFIHANWPANPLGTGTEFLDATNMASGQWNRTGLDLEIPAGYVGVVPIINVSAHLAGNWYFDLVRIIRTEGNRAELRSGAMAVVPQARYRLVGSARSDAPVAHGRLEVTARFSAPGRADVVVDVTTLEPTKGEWKLLSGDASPPSGYDTATLSAVGVDVEGGSFWLDDVALVLDDTTHVVFDVLAPSNATYTEVLSDTTAPAGAERVHVQVVAEAGGAGWVVDDVSLARIGVTPATTASVVRDLLKHPDTGAALLSPGAVEGDDVVAYDWTIRNLTNREALRHLSRAGVASPVREWRVNADATLDWGTAPELFVDRRDVVLAEGDVFLLEAPVADEDGEDAVSDLKVIGAERKTTTGDTLNITGTAAVAGSGAVDWFGNPLRRTRLVENSTIDHPDFAASYAAYLAALAAGEPAVELRLADWRALGRFSVGDWIYVHHREAGLEDLANEMAVAGRPVFAKKVRVLSRNWKLGSGPFRAEVRRPGATTLDITDAVRWEPETTAEVGVGSLLADFAPDPQGGAAFNQFLRYRASR